jgi:3-hydroxy acid dehydrogenase / malonic semialdehyde reductase
MKKTVFITGATSGFGEACAATFAAHKYNLILNGRREERLEALCNKLEEQYSVSCLALPFDVRDQKEVFEAVAGLPEEWKQIDVLVNNAGLALGRDLFQDARIEDWDNMIDTNVKGLLYVSKAVTPLMIARGKGQVINLGSIAGKEVYEKGNVYCASKHAVDAISTAMRIDLLPHRIKVTAIHPGAAETEFSLVRFKGNEDAARKIYEGYQPLTARDVAEVIYFTASLPDHVCINDLVITPTQQANSFYLHKS